MSEQTIGYYEALREVEDRIAKERARFEAQMELLAAYDLADNAQIGRDAVEEEESPQQRRFQAEMELRAAHDLADNAPIQEVSEEDRRSQQLGQPDQPGVESDNPFFPYGPSLNDGLWTLEQENKKQFEPADQSVADDYFTSYTPPRLDGLSFQEAKELEELAERVVDIKEMESPIRARTEIQGIFNEIQNDFLQEFREQFPEGQALDLTQFHEFQDRMERAYDAVLHPERYCDVPERGVERAIESEREGTGSGGEMTDRAQERPSQESRERTDRTVEAWESQMSDYAREMQREEMERGPRERSRGLEM